MADETFAVDGEEANDKEAAVIDFLVEETQGLKKEEERSDLQRKHSDLQDVLSKKAAKRASDESYAKSFAAEVERLESNLSLAYEDLASAKLTARKYQDEVRRLARSYKDLQREFHFMNRGLNGNVVELTRNIYDLQAELLDKKKFNEKEQELVGKIKELRSELTFEKEKSREINGNSDLMVPLMQSHTLGAAAFVGVAALAVGIGASAVGTVVYIRLAKRR